ncbi:MAG TPA: hypothetical protein VE987_16010 [Polyangiaceae bacterium]|nr:hypothetical protein [Polyangiaceae bacterium]
MRLVRLAAVASIVVTSAGLPACVFHPYPPTIGGYATAYAEDVPPNIYAYPHTYYGGGYAYLVGDRWYYPTHQGWVTFRGEPQELYRYRTGYVQRAPRANPGFGPRYAPPPQYGYPPPATRVR